MEDKHDNLMWSHNETIDAYCIYDRNFDKEHPFAVYIPCEKRVVLLRKTPRYDNPIFLKNWIEERVKPDPTPALTLLRKARDLHEDDTINFTIPGTEEEAERMVSRIDDGAWVQAWVWVEY